MKVSKPYIDKAQVGRKYTPDWLVTVKTGSTVEVHRFPSERAAHEGRPKLCNSSQEKR